MARSSSSASSEDLFTLGDAEDEAGAGQILFTPAGTPHEFENLGPGPLETIDIHENGSFITDWLERVVEMPGAVVAGGRSISGRPVCSGPSARG